MDARLGPPRRGAWLVDAGPQPAEIEPLDDDRPQPADWLWPDEGNLVPLGLAVLLSVLVAKVTLWIA